MRMMLHITGILLAAIGTTASSQDAALPISSKEHCMEGPLAQFGQYIGDWDIADSRLSQDGTQWTDGQGARWNFVCVGEGAAVQDFWIPNGGPVGTNLRTYNPDGEKWEIAWAVKGQPGFAHIQASLNTDDNIVMHYVSPPQSPLRQITFYPASENSWKWTLEFSFDGGEKWTEVYRIKATRRH